MTGSYGISIAPCPILDPSGSPLQGKGLPLSEVCNHPSNTSHPSLVRGSGVTAPVPPVTEALVEEPLVGGRLVWLWAVDGVQQHVMPYQIRAMVAGLTVIAMPGMRRRRPAGRWRSCARRSPSPVRPPPCGVCGGIERWEDGGIRRCVTCWPLEGRRTDAGETWLRLPSGPRKETDDRHYRR